ncbi:hypothetical protein FOA52_001489 [Chlamydomonas sp. UWO 241]|nr:hypothetical protein FOA52_001489 [Chlamydomonas sp. UWO 241]
MAPAGTGARRAEKVVVAVSLEDDPAHVSVYGAQPDSKGRALYSAVVTLTLGVLGSTILPVPYAFSKIGILVGTLTMLTVASVNDATCCMLVRAAALTGCYSYEELAEWAGGRRAKFVTQASLILLLFGTMCGGLAFLSDVARIMVLKGLPDQAPELLKTDGRPVMVVVVVLVLVPLCLQRHIRQFEKAATVGVVVVVALCAIIITKAVSLGFPGVRSGELPIFSLKIDEHLPEAFSVLGFAFYMQPMLMPLLREMPRGPAGVAGSERAVHIVLYGVASMVYGTVGVFGASIFGEATESNIMVNDILDNATATLVLYAALIVYLCCGMVTTHYALRASVDVLLVGPSAPYAIGRHVTETVLLIASATCVALAFPTQAEKIFAFTGCTAVCLACYMIPVYIHLRLESRLREGSVRRVWAAAPPGAATVALGNDDGGLEEPLLGGGGGSGSGGPFVLHETLANANGGGNTSTSYAPTGDGAVASAAAAAAAEDSAAALFESASAATRGSSRWRLLQPVAILAVGVGCSAAGLYVAAVDFMHTYGYGGVGGSGGAVGLSEPGNTQAVPRSRGGTQRASISPLWARLHCFAFWLMLFDVLWRGCNVQAVVVLLYTGVHCAHAALSSRGSSASDSGRLAVLRWLFVDHVVVLLHLARSLVMMSLTAFSGDVSRWALQPGVTPPAVYGALCTLMESYDLPTALVMTWAVLLPRAMTQLRHGNSVAVVVAHACTLTAIRVAVARRVHLLECVRACTQAALQWLRGAAAQPRPARAACVAVEDDPNPAGSIACSPAAGGPAATAHAALARVAAPRGLCRWPTSLCNGASHSHQCEGTDGALVVARVPAISAEELRRWGSHSHGQSSLALVTPDDPTTTTIATGVDRARRFDSTAEAAAHVAALMRMTPVFRPPTTRVRMSVKIPDLEPEQLHPGWRDALAAQFESTLGARLCTTYVIRGCTTLIAEFQIDVLDDGNPDGYGALSTDARISLPSSDADALVRLLYVRSADGSAPAGGGVTMQMPRSTLSRLGLPQGAPPLPLPPAIIATSPSVLACAARAPPRVHGSASPPPPPPRVRVMLTLDSPPAPGVAPLARHAGAFLPVQVVGGSGATVASPVGCALNLSLLRAATATEGSHGPSSSSGEDEEAPLLACGGDGHCAGASSASGMVTLVVEIELPERPGAFTIEMHDFNSGALSAPATVCLLPGEVAARELTQRLSDLGRTVVTVAGDDVGAAPSVSSDVIVASGAGASEAMEADSAAELSQLRMFVSALGWWVGSDAPPAADAQLFAGDDASDARERAHAPAAFGALDQHAGQLLEGARLLAYALDARLPAAATVVADRLVRVLCVEPGSLLHGCHPAQWLVSGIATTGVSNSTNSPATRAMAAALRAGADGPPGSGAAAGMGDGLSPLHRAARAGSSRCAASLVAWSHSHGVTPDWGIPGPSGLTPLHMAALLPAQSARALLESVVILPTGGAVARAAARAWLHAACDYGVTPAALAASSVGPPCDGAAVGVDAGQLSHVTATATALLASSPPHAAPRRLQMNFGGGVLRNAPDASAATSSPASSLMCKSASTPPGEWLGPATSWLVLMHLGGFALVTLSCWNPYAAAVNCLPYTAALALRYAVWWLEHKRGWRAPPALHSALGPNLGFLLNIARVLLFLPTALQAPGACLADQTLARCRIVIRVKRGRFGNAVQTLVGFAEAYPMRLFVPLQLLVRLPIWVGVFKAIGSTNPLVESIEDTAMIIAMAVGWRVASAAWSRGFVLTSQGKKKGQGSTKRKDGQPKLKGQ